MHSNEKLIETFYTAFGKKDYETMKACYAENAEFSDPAFPHLKGKEVGAMWQMLIMSSQNLTIRFSDVKADDKAGSAIWIANYNFSKTGRPVENHIKANFVFENGKILKHKDEFNLWKWSQMALGLKGYLLGWSPIIKNAVQKTTSTNLDLFMRRNKLK